VAKNANHYYRGLVGDEERAFRGVSLEAEGLWSKLRRISFDCDPSGFLVDHLRRPYDLKYLADTLMTSAEGPITIAEKNRRFGVIFQEVRGRLLVQSLAEFMAQLDRAAQRGKRAKLKQRAFSAIVDEAWPGGPVSLDEIYLLPALIEQQLETSYGKRTAAGETSEVGGEVVGDVGGRWVPTWGGRWSTRRRGRSPPLRGQRSEVIVKR
jgi:hypothetical protein